MKLEHALICLDCNEIYKKEATTTGQTYCPVCVSRNNFPISNWFNHEVQSGKDDGSLLREF